MPTEFSFDESYWYSGCDGSYFAELLPAHSGYWFIALLGQGYLATSVMPHPHKSILKFLAKYGFVFEQATWDSVKSSRFTQNPFLAKLPAHIAIAISQTGKHLLPQKPTILEFGRKSDSKPKTRPKPQLYFILTADQEYLHIGVAIDPYASLHKLQSAYPQPLSLVGQLSDHAKLSQTIHQKFNHLITQGNWFRYTQELQTYITSLLAT